MAKPFISYQQQINKLEQDKNLVIADKAAASEELKNLSYFALISGYKSPFIDSRTRKYVNGASFDDVVALYSFDDALRLLFFKYIFKVERKMRSLISYTFSDVHGEQQQEYLDRNNYNANPRYTNDIGRLINMLSYRANNDTDHEYLVHHRRKYHNVPLWVVINTLTFGQTSRLFEYLPQNMQGCICREYSGLQKNEMIRFLRILSIFRNLCAHGERLFSYVSSVEIPDMALHQKMSIPKNGTTYAVGKKDLYAVVIVLKYLLPQKDFMEFKRQLNRLLNTLEKQCCLTKEDVLVHMHFPSNWDSITRYKV